MTGPVVLVGGSPQLARLTTAALPPQVGLACVGTLAEAEALTPALVVLDGDSLELRRTYRAARGSPALRGRPVGVLRTHATLGPLAGLLLSASPPDAIAMLPDDHGVFAAWVERAASSEVDPRAEPALEIVEGEDTAASEAPTGASAPLRPEPAAAVGPSGRSLAACGGVAEVGADREAARATAARALAGAVAERDALAQQLAVVAQVLASAEAARDAALTERAALAEQLAATAESLATAEATRDAALTEKAALANQAGAMDAALQDACARIEALEADQAAAEGRAQGHARALAALQSGATAAQTAAEEARADAEQARAELEEARADAEQAREEQIRDLTWFMGQLKALRGPES